MQMANMMEYLVLAHLIAKTPARVNVAVKHAV